LDQEEVVGQGNNKLFVKKKEQVDSDSQKDNDNHPGLFGEKKKTRYDDEKDRRIVVDRRRRQYRSDYQGVPRDDPHQRRKREKNRHHAFFEHDSAPSGQGDKLSSSSQRYLGSHQNEEYIPVVYFDSRYFLAVVIFIGGMVGTIQTCRYASIRVSKGRRDL
jgi:hypothetical protein